MSRRYALVPRRRTALKALHVAMPPLLIWFLVMTPADVTPLGLFRFHSTLGLIFVTLSLFWTGMHLSRGLASRPGPKLPPWARPMHQILHKTIIWGLFGVALTGFLIGLTSDTLLKAAGVLPFAPPLGLPEANAWVRAFHTWEFRLLAVIVVAHAGFHIWRHLSLRDNALRIMAPRFLHRWL